MRARRWATFVLGVLLLAAPAYAYLPANIEGVIKTWFNSAGQLISLRFWPAATAPTPQSDTCVFYMDKVSKVVKISCDGAAATNLLGTGTISCSDDGAGTLTCNNYASPDQDPGAVNFLSLFRNTVARTCAANGTANKLTLLDTIASPNRWCLCDGTTQLICFPSTGSSTAADDTVLLGTSGDTATWKAIPDCPDTAGKHLNYDATTNTFSCGTS